MTKAKETVTEIKSVEGYATVSKTLLGEETVQENKFRVREFVTDPAVVSVKAGFTCNLGNYESARIDVMVSSPCYVEEVDEMFLQVKEWVDTRLAKEVKELMAQKER
jgi:hypothetical protein